VNGGKFKVDNRFISCTDINGVPDILGIDQKGRAIAIECKSDTGKLSAAQKAFKYQWTGRGGVYVLARSIEDLDEGLKAPEGRYKSLGRLNSD
jgi:hypothetical protein